MSYEDLKKLVYGIVLFHDSIGEYDLWKEIPRVFELSIYDLRDILDDLMQDYKIKIHPDTGDYTAATVGVAVV